MQPRLLSGQPWDAAVDVLVVPIAGEPAFEGPLGELDRRSGGELSSLARLGELRSKRFSTALAAPGELPAGRLLAVAAGRADELDAETVRWVAASAIRRLGGLHVGRLGVWLDPLLAGPLAPVLTAISCGAVYFGALSYIGNAPNFMAKAMVESQGLKMPSFLGFLGWSCLCLLPWLAVLDLVFFRL